LLSTVLDEVMAWVIGVNTRSFAFAAELNVRFARPVSPGIEMKVRAELTEHRRGRLFLTRGEVVGPDGVVHAEATGKFLPIPAERQAGMLADFAVDPSPWIGSPTS
jgi:acyl-coenzyme A thioesterase PaaI-like protein